MRVWASRNRRSWMTNRFSRQPSEFWHSLLPAMLFAVLLGPRKMVTATWTWGHDYLRSICQGQGEYIGGFMIKNSAAGKLSWQVRRQNSATVHAMHQGLRASKGPWEFRAFSSASQTLDSDASTTTSFDCWLFHRKNMLFTRQNSASRYEILASFCFLVFFCETGVAQGLRRDAGKVESASSSDVLNEWWKDTWFLDYVVMPATVGLCRGSESDHVVTCSVRYWNMRQFEYLYSVYWMWYAHTYIHASMSKSMHACARTYMRT